MKIQKTDEQILMWYNYSVSVIYKNIFTLFRKKHNGNKNNKKTFSIKMKEDVGMSKPKKHANKVGKLT